MGHLLRGNEFKRHETTRVSLLDIEEAFHLLYMLQLKFLVWHLLLSYLKLVFYKQYSWRSASATDMEQAGNQGLQ
jgi:hypothetical protein